MAKKKKAVDEEPSAVEALAAQLGVADARIVALEVDNKTLTDENVRLTEQVRWFEERRR